jgi:probable HAF family extracellular repeat protein
MMVDLSANFGYPATAAKVSGKGRIVGTGAIGGQLSRGWTMLCRDGMAILPSLVRGGRSNAYGVNTCGSIVGAAQNAAGYSQAVLWKRANGGCD